MIESDMTTGGKLCIRVIFPEIALNPLLLE